MRSTRHSRTPTVTAVTASLMAEAPGIGAGPGYVPDSWRLQQGRRQRFQVALQPPTASRIVFLGAGGPVVLVSGASLCGAGADDVVTPGVRREHGRGHLLALAPEQAVGVGEEAKSVPGHGNEIEGDVARVPQGHP